MKVLMFGWEFPPFISGGLGTACYGITKGLVHHGVDVTFVLPTKRGQQLSSHVRALAADEILGSADFDRVIQRKEFERRIREKISFGLSPYYTADYCNEVYERLFRLREQVGISRKRSILDFTGNYGKDLHSEVSAYGIIGEFLGLTEDFDVIHAHDWLTYPAGVAAKQASKKPLIIHVHATEFDRSGDHVNQAVYEIERHGMHNADLIVAVSHYTKNIIVKRYGVHPDKVVVVHNAVDKQCQFDRWGLKKPIKDKVVLFLGRVTMQKGPDYFIEAANLVLKKTKNVRFVMAGSGDMLHRIINRMAYLKIANRFHFTGFLKGPEVERMFALSDLYVMPSVSEPFGISAFESLLYDVPCIISKQTGVSEVLTNAVMVDFWDVQKLSEQIVRILTDDRLAADIVARCKGDLENVAWENAGWHLKNIYQSLADGGQR
ncbi:MAG: glycosyltransferase family 4 protein [Fibrobacterota bacterium]